MDYELENEYENVMEECLELGDDNCKFCGWNSGYEQSHISFGNWSCDYIVANYHLKLDEDGELEFTKKVEPDCDDDVDLKLDEDGELEITKKVETDCDHDVEFNEFKNT